MYWLNLYINRRTLAAETSTYASILTITAFTVERYVAICHPVKSRLAFKSGLQRSVRLVLLIWIVAAVCSVPIVLQYGVVYVQVSRTVLCWFVRSLVARMYCGETAGRVGAGLGRVRRFWKPSDQATFRPKLHVVSPCYEIKFSAQEQYCKRDMWAGFELDRCCRGGGALCQNGDWWRFVYGRTVHPSHAKTA